MISGPRANPTRDPLLADVKVIGLGGVGAVVAQAMAQFLASRGGPRALWLIDGDRYEERNRDRVLFEGYENKAIAKARELGRATGGRVAVRPVPEYATPRNVARLVGDGDIVFACVDNHASRRLIGNRCRRLRDAVLISGGNDGIEAGQTGTCGNAQIHVRAAGVDRTSHVARYHPEVAHPADRRPDQLGCAELAGAAPQLLFTNLAVGAAMLGLYHAWQTGTLDHEEVYLDIAAGRMVPVRRTATPARVLWCWARPRDINYTDHAADSGCNRRAMEGGMSDLLSDARGLRQKLYLLEVLLQIEHGRRSRGWFTAQAPEDPERAAALKRLAKTGLIETVPPPVHFRLTTDGREFLTDVRAKVGAGGELNWTRADEIDFSKL